MKRRCGNCLYGLENNADSVFCHGAPPSVVETVRDEASGGLRVNSQVPILPRKHVPCALHAYRWSPLGIVRNALIGK